MKLSLRQKIYAVILLLLLLAAATASLLSIISLQSFFRKRTISQMQTELGAIEYFLTTRKLSFQNFVDYEEFSSYARITGRRVTLIDSAGKILFDSFIPREKLAAIEKIKRPELQMAQRNGFGEDERSSSLINLPMLYTAKTTFSCGPVRFIRLAMRLDEFNKAQRAIQTKILFGDAFAVLIISLIGFYIAFRITHPIGQLADVAEKIKAGNYSARFSLPSYDEIGALASLLNEILDKMNLDLLRMKKLERMRSQFLGNVSHELRTPIFSVQGYLETIMQHPGAEPEQLQTFVRKAYRQAVRLNILLTELIDISRIESGEMKLTFSPFEIHPWLERLVIEAHEQHNDNDVSIQFVNENNQGVMVIADQDRLRQVINNLLTNAVKYNKKDGSVRIGYIAHSDTVEIFVSDTGRGIDKKHLPHIFQRFYRVDKERSREVGGTGLGLAIVKHILEAHNSKINVISQPGVGSRFSFSLKRASKSHSGRNSTSAG